MRIDILVPDVAVPSVAARPATDAAAFTQAYEHVAKSLDDAQAAERQFAAGQGSLLEMTTARARADVELSTAVAVASRIGQIASTLGNMSL